MVNCSHLQYEFVILNFCYNLFFPLNNIFYKLQDILCLEFFIRSIHFSTLSFDITIQRYWIYKISLLDYLYLNFSYFLSATFYSNFPVFCWLKFFWHQQTIYSYYCIHVYIEILHITYNIHIFTCTKWLITQRFTSIFNMNELIQRTGTD